MFNFYAQDLTRKVMGKTRHGSHSVVYVTQDGVDSEVVHYHEEAHRSLNSATTVGKYLSALAFVASQQPERLARLRDAVSEIATLCLYTHEGYAMAMQEILSRGVQSETEAAAIRLRLDDLYRLAREQYRSAFERAALVMLERASVVYADAFAQCEEIVCRVLSIAAMSVPLKEVIADQASLPSYPVFKHVRADSPDKRLDRLVGSWTGEFLEKCYREHVVASEQVRAAGRSRPVDDCWNRLAEELCQLGGLRFEPPDALDLGSLCEKMGLPGVREHDGRDTPLSNRAVLDSISLAIHRGPIQFTSSMTWKSAHQVLKLINDRVGVTPDVVAEVFPWPNETLADSTVLMLHLYCDKRAYADFLSDLASAEGERERNRELFREAFADFPDGVAFLMIQMQVRAPDEILRAEPEAIPARIQHGSFTWLGFEHLFEPRSTGPRAYDRTRFEACGRLVFPYSAELNGTERYSALSAVPPRVALFETSTSTVTDYLRVEDDPLGSSILAVLRSISGLPPFRTVEDSFATALGLLYLRPQLSESEFVLPVVFPHRHGIAIAQVGGLPVATSSYPDTCVCHTLVTGLHAEFFTYRSEGESHE